MGWFRRKKEVHNHNTTTVVYQNSGALALAKSNQSKLSEITESLEHQKLIQQRDASRFRSSEQQILQNLRSAKALAQRNQGQLEQIAADEETRRQEDLAHFKRSEQELLQNLRNAKTEMEARAFKSALEELRRIYFKKLDEAYEDINPREFSEALHNSQLETSSDIERCAGSILSELELESKKCSPKRFEQLKKQVLALTQQASGALAEKVALGLRKNEAQENEEIETDFYEHMTQKEFLERLHRTKLETPSDIQTCANAIVSDLLLESKKCSPKQFEQLKKQVLALTQQASGALAEKVALGLREREENLRSLSKNIVGLNSDPNSHLKTNSFLNQYQPLFEPNEEAEPAENKVRSSFLKQVPVLESKIGRLQNELNGLDLILTRPTAAKQKFKTLYQRSKSYWKEQMDSLVHEYQLGMRSSVRLTVQAQRTIISKLKAAEAQFHLAPSFDALLTLEVEGKKETLLAEKRSVETQISDLLSLERIEILRSSGIQNTNRTTHQ